MRFIRNLGPNFEAKFKVEISHKRYKFSVCTAGLGYFVDQVTYVFTVVKKIFKINLIFRKIDALFNSIH